MFFTKDELTQHIAKKKVRIHWQDDFDTDATLTWYESKREMRVTGFYHNFPFRGAEYTGALFVFNKMDDCDFDGFILNNDDDIEAYLNAFGMSPADTNSIVNHVPREAYEETLIKDWLATIGNKFPESQIISSKAQTIYDRVSGIDGLIVNKRKISTDNLLIGWTEEEYKLFRSIEEELYLGTISAGFKSIDTFISFANSILNRRKSRAGKSLEHHLEEIFQRCELAFTAQAKTEGNKRPDFVFPSEAAYHDKNFPIEKLCTLAAKTTCKDRWRQILNEANRFHGRTKYLCTLQQGISANQMDEMAAEQVTLVVPKRYISAFPKEKQQDIWTLDHFVGYVKELEQ